ncbi:hypothetical protein CRG98_046731, partial [Punica granatum]
MGRCPCFGSWKTRKKLEKNESVKSKLSVKSLPKESAHEVSTREGGSVAIDKAHTFTYRELATATKDFQEESFIGQGGFGAVYLGTLKRTGQ